MTDPATLVSSARSNRVLVAALLLLTAALYLPWLGYTDLVHEEPRRAVIARNMMETGDYLIPTFAGRVYLAKPPAFNWMIAAASAPTGEVTELTARLPSVIALGLLAVLMVLTAGRHLGTAGRWLLGLSILLAPELMYKAVLAEIELAFTLLVSASLWLWFELDERGHRGLSLWLPPALIVVLAFLTKREPALVFYYFGIGAYLLARHRFGELFRPAHLTAAALTLALIGGWLALLVTRTGLEAFLANFQDQILTRGLSSGWRDYLVNFASYPLELVAATLPFSAMLVPLAFPAVLRAVRDRYGRTFTFAALVTLINLPVYWFRADSVVRYFLPMLPTVLVITAMVFDVRAGGHHRISPTRTDPLWRSIALVVGVAGLALSGAAVAISLPGIEPVLHGPFLPKPISVLLALALFAAFSGVLGVSWRRPAAGVLGALLCFGLLHRFVHVNFMLPEDAAEIATRQNAPAVLDRIRAALPNDTERVKALGHIPPALWFYDRGNLLVGPASSGRAGTAPSPVILVDRRNRELVGEPGGEVSELARLSYGGTELVLLRLTPRSRSR